MRPAIADLTRAHYADLVEIQDHACTIAQRVGDRAIGAASEERARPVAAARERAAWHAQGRLVPGIVPQIFFWDLPDNKEGRPVAGLSACNYVEADAVASAVRRAAATMRNKGTG